MMQKSLQQSVSRLCWVGGSNFILNSLPLKSYQLESALDQSLVIMLRDTSENQFLNTSNLALAEWTIRTAVDELCYLIENLLSKYEINRIVEVGVSISPLAEILQNRNIFDRKYTLVGPECQREIFNSFYGWIDRFDYANLLPNTQEKSHLTVYNQVSALRHGIGLELDWVDIIRTQNNPVIFALWVALESTVTMLTANGHLIKLPNIHHVKSILSKSNPRKSWCVKVKNNFEENLFLRENLPSNKIYFENGFEFSIPQNVNTALILGTNFCGTPIDNNFQSL